MKIELKRSYNCPNYCIGHLYVDGRYVCDTIEDRDRGLEQTMSVDEIKRRKVYAQTAIPTGVYDVTLDVTSGTFSKKRYYYDFCRGKLPRLLYVPGYDGILIHRGSNQDSSAGCLIVGYNTIKGRVTGSQQAFEKLYGLLKSARDGIKIEITRKYRVL